MPSAARDRFGRARAHAGTRARHNTFPAEVSSTRRGARHPRQDPKAVPFPRLSRAANIDTQALGLIGLDAALTAIVIAAQGLLGPHYWVAIPGLAISLLIAGSVLAVTRFDLGPKPEQPYEQIEAAAISGEEAIAKLLMNLVETDKTNQRPLQSKAIRLVIALGVLALTILYTTLQLAL